MSWFYRQIPVNTEFEKKYRQRKGRISDYHISNENKNFKHSYVLHGKYEF